MTSPRVNAPHTLKDRHFLITGAAGGIGAAIARRLSAEGAAVALADLDANGALALAATLPRASAFGGDLSQPDIATQVVRQAEAALGPLDGLVHCPAIGKQVDLLNCPLALWERVLDVNLTATFLTCQAVARVLVQRKRGVLVGLSSGAGIRPGAGNVPYGASKAGVIALMRAFALDLAPHGVRANVLVPGPTDTPLMRGIVGAAVPMLEQRSMLKRLGQPEEVAAAARFLLSDAASYMTGSVFMADGGCAAGGTDLRR